MRPFPLNPLTAHPPAGPKGVQTPHRLFCFESDEPTDVAEPLPSRPPVPLAALPPPPSEPGAPLHVAVPPLATPRSQARACAWAWQVSLNYLTEATELGMHWSPPLHPLAAQIVMSGKSWGSRENAARGEQAEPRPCAGPFRSAGRLPKGELCDLCCPRRHVGGTSVLCLLYLI